MMRVAISRFIPASVPLALIGGVMLLSSTALAYESSRSLSPTIVVHEAHHRQKHASAPHPLKSRYAAHIRNWFTCSTSACLAPVPHKRSTTVYAGGGCAPGISAVETTRYGDERDFECFILDQ
jgi:hypothetical protein